MFGKKEVLKVRGSGKEKNPEMYPIWLAVLFRKVSKNLDNEQ